MNKKNVLILFLRQLLVLTLLLAATGAARAETAETGAAQAVVRDFFEYLLSKGANIGNDAKAQERWLTRDMRALLLESTQAVVEARKFPEVDGPDPKMPDNDTFLDAWDHPSTCRVLTVAEKAPHLEVKVFCSWKQETNYPGIVREGTVLAAKEDGIWRISNITWGQTPYAAKDDVVHILQLLKSESQKLAAEYGAASKKTPKPQNAPKKAK